MTDNLTTRGVARLLSVSEATVKRWADNGRLLPEKTVGGHRRFSLQTVAQLRREMGIGPGTDATQRRGARKKSAAGPLPSSADFLESLLRGDEKEAGAVLVNAYLQGHSLASLFDGTVCESMHQIGDLWFKGTITIADEHLATRAMLGALQRLRGIAVPAEPAGLKAICCGIEGDLHELPTHLVEMVLETEGWEVRNLGGNTPLFALRDMVSQQRPQLVCISARSILDLDRATAEYAQLRKITGKIGVTVVVGGEGFRDKTLRERFPSEYYADNYAGFTEFIRSLTPDK